MDHSRTLVYIAGPFTGKGETRAEQRADTEAKIARAVQLGIRVARLGAYPVIPHANTSHPEFEDVQDYGFWIEGTAELLERCDAVLFTDDWRDSSCARGEERLAAERGIPRFYTLSDLACWLSPALAAFTGSTAPTLSEAGYATSRECETLPSPPPVRPTLDDLYEQLAAADALPASPLDLEVTIDSEPVVLTDEEIAGDPYLRERYGLPSLRGEVLIAGVESENVPAEDFGAIRLGL